jgi:hypothetical protein
VIKTGDYDYQLTPEEIEFFTWYKKQKNRELIEMVIVSLLLFVAIYGGWL